MSASRLGIRPLDPAALERLTEAGTHPVLARLYAGRGVHAVGDLGQQLDALLAPDTMLGLDAAARLLADHIEADRPILIVADYDCDGATACAVMVRGLRRFGARVDYIVPNRFEHGYGLSPTIVDLAATHRGMGAAPALLVTVDNGIASVDGTARARELGLDVLITDHHLPGPVLPAATVIVDPNQPGCTFESKHLAGVGVAFYTLLALRAEWRTRGRFANTPEPRLQELLDLVALGTVADVVRLDRNNRLLVAAGLRRIRAGRAVPGLQALLQVAGREARRLSCSDLGFAVGPRINASGRLADIRAGIECLLTDDPDTARQLAAGLDQINRERREREAVMREEALTELRQIEADAPVRQSIVVHREAWHEGIIGLVASRLKDRAHRPTFALAPASGDPGVWRGSGRSIPGLHLRDALDLVSKREPGLLKAFGGHAMAAGLSIEGSRIETFKQAFEEAVLTLAEASCFERETLTDGSLPAEHAGPALIEQIDEVVWGQGFPEPLFCDEFEVRQQRLLKDRHSRLSLARDGRLFNAIYFDHAEPLPARVRLAYRLARDDFRGDHAVQLIVTAIDQSGSLR